MGKVSISKSVIALPEKDFKAWFAGRKLPGVWTDYYPVKVSKKTEKPETVGLEGGG
jgi:hypothetical protein